MAVEKVVQPPGGMFTPADRVAVTGTLKGYDQLMNLVLDNVKEMTRGLFHHLVPSDLC